MASVSQWRLIFLVDGELPLFIKLVGGCGHMVYDDLCPKRRVDSTIVGEMRPKDIVVVASTWNWARDAL